MHLSRDFSEIPAVLDAMYEAVSFAQGESPDWLLGEQIFLPEARLSRLTESSMQMFDLSSYRRDLEAQIRSGAIPSLLEREIAQRVEAYGDIAQVFSTYETAIPAEREANGRGINSIQMVRKNGRWWIISMIWFREGPRTPIPNQYLLHPGSE